MKLVKGQILVSVALAASSLAWASDPTVAPTNFKNIAPTVTAAPTVGNFGGTGMTAAATQAPMAPVGSFNAGHVLQGPRTLGADGDLPPAPTGFDSSKGATAVAVARMRKTTLPPSTLTAEQAHPTTACGFVQWVMDRMEPSKAGPLAVGTVVLNRGEAPAMGLKDVILFSSVSTEQQNFAYSVLTRKFYRLDMETNTLIEMASLSRAGGAKSEIYNFEYDNLLNIQGMNQMIALSVKALASPNEGVTKTATSEQIGCSDSPNWFIQRLGDKTKLPKAK